LYESGQKQSYSGDFTGYRLPRDGGTATV